jgi:hypothetical protein
MSATIGRRTQRKPMMHWALMLGQRCGVSTTWQARSKRLNGHVSGFRRRISLSVRRGPRVSHMRTFTGEPGLVVVTHGGLRPF